MNITFYQNYEELLELREDLIRSKELRPLTAHEMRFLRITKEF